jgi:hypothetical protein
VDLTGKNEREMSKREARDLSEFINDFDLSLSRSSYLFEQVIYKSGGG